MTTMLFVLLFAAVPPARWSGAGEAPVGGDWTDDWGNDDWGDDWDEGDWGGENGPRPGTGDQVIERHAPNRASRATRDVRAYHFSIVHDQAAGGIEAFRALLPEDWRGGGSVAWDLFSSSLPELLFFRAVSGAGDAEINYVHHRDNYAMPDGGVVKLPNKYDTAWAAPDGKILLGPRGFDPSGYGNYTELQRLPHILP